MEFIAKEIERLETEGLYNQIRTLESGQGAWVTIEGEEVLNFCSNNYLGLAADPRLVEAAKEAIDEYGVGPGAVRTIAGTLSLHEELEEKLTEFKKAEATIVFQSGFNANLATIPALVGKGDIIYSDALNHASIIDGCRLSGAKVKVYGHDKLDELEELLIEDQDKDCKQLIVVDGVFSMDGDIADLPGIAKLAKKYDVMTMVDDAHGEGVLGSHGRGIVDHFDLHGQIDVEVGTFSKALGVVGGCVSGSKKLIELLKQQGRPFLFSSAPTVPDMAAVMESVNILQESDELVQKLWDNGEYFTEKMEQLGFDTGESETPITPVMIGTAEKAAEFSSKLLDEQIFAQSIGFPTVPKNTARIRVMISAAHSKEDLDFALEKFEKVGKEMGLI
ncbi:glycine C-acetyltransferase [Natroniella sulfidigena]|uniref:glycine C-acetyltransferase n=1 Tax=Natroniella sulfidigena TaxID=723921 RepID=UPI00200A5AFF|nr:glycine C-acetyltransferase [Natroniella sulfidigena]MCK8817547.1 glycine C-acetyltransferase [Natroniella sulfidigena]